MTVIAQRTRGLAEVTVTVPGRQLAPHDRISLSGLATERKVGIGETDCVASMLEDKRGPSLRQNRAAINDANQGLGGAVNDIAAAARHSNERLRDIQAEIEAGVRALEPTIDTPAGQQQMAAFLTARPQWLRQSSTPLKKPRRLRQRASAVFARVSTPSASDTADSTQSGQRSVTPGADAGHTLTAPPTRAGSSNRNGMETARFFDSRSDDSVNSRAVIWFSRYRRPSSSAL